MFKYRDHRGGLVESMETVREMTDFAELKGHVTKIFGEGKITVKHYCYDARINWDTYIVCHDGRGIGFTDSPVHTQESTNTAPPWNLAA